MNMRHLRSLSVALDLRSGFDDGLEIADFHYRKNALHYSTSNTGHVDCDYNPTTWDTACWAGKTVNFLQVSVLNVHCPIDSHRHIEQAAFCISLTYTEESVPKVVEVIGTKTRNERVMILKAVLDQVDVLHPKCLGAKVRFKSFGDEYLDEIYLDMHCHGMDESLEDQEIELSTLTSPGNCYYAAVEKEAAKAVGSQRDRRREEANGEQNRQFSPNIW